MYGFFENVWVFEKSMGFLRGIRVTTRTLRGFVWFFENVWVFEKSMGFLRGIRVTTRTLCGFVWSFLAAWMSRGFPSDLTWSFLAAWMSRGFSSILMIYHYCYNTKLLVYSPYQFSKIFP